MSLLNQIKTDLELSITPDAKLSREVAQKVLRATRQKSAPKRSYRRNILLLFSLMAALLAAAGYVSYRNVNSLVNDSRRVEHTHRVLGNLSETFSALKDVESGSRGYVLTGNAEHLEPTYAAHQQVLTGLRTLKQLTSDNPAQQQRLAMLEQLINEKLEIMRAAITLRQQEGLDAVLRKLAPSGKGKVKMDEIRSIIADMESSERQLLQDRNSSMYGSARTLLIVVLLGIGLSFSILAVVYFMIRRESIKRMTVEDGLEQTNTKLQQGIAGMEQLASEMNLTATMGELLQSCLTFQEAGKVINKVVPHLLPETAGALCIINPSKNFVETVMTWGKATPPETLFTPEECWALRRGRMHQVRNGSGLECDHVNGSNPHGYLCLPLVAHGETLGVLHISALQADALGESKQHVIRNITEQFSLTLANLRLQQTLRTQSIRDPLTGLFNRRYMEASLEREMLRSKRHETPLSVIMLDIDHFKRFNDTFGHGAGDLLMQEFGKVLKSCARGEDIVCRYGGEEFMVILPGASLDVARQRAEHINEVVRQMQVEYHGQALASVTVSLGVAAYPEHSDAPDELVRIADAALYNAKRSGRNCVVVSDHFDRNGQAQFIGATQTNFSMPAHA